MYKNKRIAVVMPAYNAELTLRATYDEVINQGIVDDIILVDDGSRDGTVALARSLPSVSVHVHDRNLGYGGNQKSCYRIALEMGADIVIMVHPDYQYTPKLIPALASMIANGLHDFVVGSRILGGFAMDGGMPWWKYAANRFLTAAQNLLMGAKLSEYHTGYRAYSRSLLENMQLDGLSNDFIFDNQFIAQALWRGYMIGEVSCPTRYFAEASSINFRRSTIYGLGCLGVAARYFLASRLGLQPPRYLAGQRKHSQTRSPEGLQPSPATAAPPDSAMGAPEANFR